MAFNPQTINKELDMANLAKHNANYSAIKTELDAHDTHVAAQTAHGSTSAATAGKIMQRDSAGRAKVAAPSASDDIARKAEVDGVQTNLTTHAADAVAHLTSAEHTKLTGIASGAEVNQNAFSQVNNVPATTKTDTITIEGGIGITVSTDAASKKVTVTATGTAAPGAHASTHISGGSDVIPNAVTSGASGLMSGTDAEFVRVSGESKSGAQSKADTALSSAKSYADSLYEAALPKSGGTLTGDITISKSSPKLTLDNTAASSDIILLESSSGSFAVQKVVGSSTTNLFSVNTAGDVSIYDSSGNVAYVLQTTLATLTSSAANILTGSGSPEGSITAPVGRLYLRTNGGANSTLYVKESGVGNTGWVTK